MKKRVTTAITYEEGQVNLKFGGDICWFSCASLRQPIGLTLDEMRFMSEAYRDYLKTET